MRARNVSFAKITLLVVFALIASFALLLAASHVYLKNLTENYVQSWLAAETLNIDQGQLLPVFIKSQRMLLSSKMISGIAVVSFNSENGSSEYLIEFGDKISLSENLRQVPASLNTSSLGLFSYLVRYPLPNKNSTVAFFLSRWPSAVFEYFALVTFVLIMSLIVAGYIYLLVKRESEIRELLLKEGLARLVRDEDPGPLLRNEVPSIVGSWHDMKTAMQSYQKREIENHLHLQFANLAKQVAHDIRSPLSALRIGVEKLRHVAPDASDIVAQATERIQATAEGLVNRAKGSAEDLTHLALKPLVEELLAEKRLEYHTQENLKMLLSGNNASACAQPRALQNVLSNLINNSVEAMPNGGLVAIEIETLPESVKLHIRDNGTGIPSDILEKLGAAPVSAGKKGSHSGLGIGILSAREKVESWGGTLTIESEVGRGTQVTLEFRQ